MEGVGRVQTESVRNRQISREGGQKNTPEQSKKTVGAWSALDEVLEGGWWYALKCCFSSITIECFLNSLSTKLAT